MYANATKNGYYRLFTAENATSEEDIFDHHGDRGGPCENYFKLPPLSLYTNMSQVLYPGSSQSLNSEEVIKVCALIIILITGLLGNISVLLTLALNRSMRTTVNFYIANLAVADFMTCIFAVPVLIRMFPIHYPLGGFICQFGTFALSTCMTCSVFTLATISCDRFMTVFFPLHVRFTKMRKSFVTTLIWILSMVVSIPYILADKLRVTEWKDFQYKRCIPDWSSDRYYSKSLGLCYVRSPLFIFHSLLMTVFLYFVPVLIMIAAYSFILWKLSKSNASREQSAISDNIDPSGKKRMHKMVFTVILAFAICWTPFQVGNLYDLTHPRRSEVPIWWVKYAWFAWCIELCNSFVNPIIYVGMTKEFRQGIRAVLSCRKPIITPKPSQNTHHTPDSTIEHDTQEVNLDMEIKVPVSD